MSGYLLTETAEEDRRFWSRSPAHPAIRGNLTNVLRAN